MEPDEDEDAPLSRLWALPALGVGVGVFAALQHFSSIARAEAAGIASAVLFSVALTVWKRHREAWFWPAIAAAVTVHGLAIWLIPWPANHEFEKSDLNFVWLDFFLYFGAAIIADRVIEWRKRAG